jgi:hypothetical protein
MLASDTPSDTGATGMRADRLIDADCHTLPQALEPTE